MTTMMSPETHLRPKSGPVAGESPPPRSSWSILWSIRDGFWAAHSQEGPQQPPVLPPLRAQQIPPGFRAHREEGPQPPGVPCGGTEQPEPPPAEAGMLGGQAAAGRAKELFISSNSKSGNGSVCAKLFTWLPGCFPSSGYFSSSVRVYSGLTCCEEPRYYLWLIIGIWLAGRIAGIRSRGAYTACSKLRSAPPSECACLRCQLTLFSLPPSR